jgi:signal transduction histidine kinase
MVQQAPIAIALTRGREIEFESINAPMLQMIGKSTMEEVIGKKVAQILPELLTQPGFPIIVGVFDTGEPFNAWEVPITLMKAGKPEHHYFNLSYSPLIENGTITGVLHVAIDVTEQVASRHKIEEREKEAQALAEELVVSNEELQAASEEIWAKHEDLRAANNQLIRTNTDLDNFIYTASHDLKAPISNIESLLQALLRTLPEESPASDRIGRITSLMQDSVDRFKKTISNLTEIVKLQKENNGEAVSVDLNQVIKEVVLDLEPLIQSSGAVVDIHLQECPGIYLSEKNLRSIVYNLLSNGIKYRSPDRLPRLEVSCKLLPGFHVLTISDNGLGLKAEHLAKLFSMFKRFHDHVEGTGIGLYMVKKMVENAGGYIEVETKEGIGTTFRVYFPI